MWILPLVGYLGALVGFGFMTLAIASGLYYLSELVEEHTVIAKRILTRLIYFVIGLQLVLCVVDRFPFWQTLVGIVAHVVYLGNMRRFPYVQLTDPLFLLSCGLVLLDHYIWFQYFSGYQQRSYQNMSSYYDAPSSLPTFSEIASYFGVCVWLVPFALFVSLSASDNVLPTMSGIGTASGTGTSAPGGSLGDAFASRETGSAKRGGGMAKALVDNVLSIFSGLGSAADRRHPDSRGR